MNRALIQKGIGSALILSGLVLLVLKVSSISDSHQTWDSWASPENGTMWFIGVLVLELVFLASRFILGYFVYLSKNMRPWLIYPLAVLTAVSGLSGIVLVAAVLVLRFWQGGVHTSKT
ncbi:hypothetical protein MK852_16185 [Shewanella benthica]|uniref:hypothetical protein n=1 Tax=Shewanella benthica TaxID=43661 RepID=UPI00187A4C6E|nr:hypothetical protein [Shewanella benthica]MBE7215957.1 hypothetical protein [Shewanella benthica]MCL1063649.1 hypothetical protein [Shewanella benthica]